MKLRVLMLALCISMTTHAGLSISETGENLTVLENGKPVLVFNTAPVQPPEGVDPKYARACYIHPLYGLDGEVLTQDFPSDHYHQRGVFWGWPETKVGGKSLNTWEMSSGHHVFETWIARSVTDEYVHLQSLSHWKFRGDDTRIVEEKVGMLVWQAEGDARAIDFVIELKNLSEENAVIEGATNKGYGGFNFRPSAERKPMIFTANDGRLKRDALEYDTPWADVSFHLVPDGPIAGAAIFQHPDNPGYPHHGWIMRKYALLGAAWPHVDPHAIEPGDTLELKYRLYIHRGDAESAEVAVAFADYIKEQTKTP